MSPRSSGLYTLTPENREILGTVPERWGRMDLLSRASLIEIGRTMRQSGLLLDPGGREKAHGRIGLIAGSSRGSLATDLEYARTLATGLDSASPALFSYTLPNIALAEAAIHYRLTGPVFSIISDSPYEEAIITARQWLACGDDHLDLVLAGETDVLPGPTGPDVRVSFAPVFPP